MRHLQGTGFVVCKIFTNIRFFAVDVASRADQIDITVTTLTVCVTNVQG